MSNWSAASSRQNRRISGSIPRSTSSVWSPCSAWVARTAAPKRSWSRARMSGPCMRGRPAVSVPLPPDGDLVLELHQAVEHALGPGRASRNVDVDGQDRVDALHGGVVVVEPTRAGAH